MSIVTIAQLYQIEILFFILSVSETKQCFCSFSFNSTLLQIVNLGITGKIAAGHARFQIMDISANSDVIARHTCAMLQVGANNASIFNSAFFIILFLVWNENCF